MAMTFELPRPDYLEFALPAAVGLAGSGAKLSDRRVGGWCPQGSCGWPRIPDIRRPSRVRILRCRDATRA